MAAVGVVLGLLLGLVLIGGGGGSFHPVENKNKHALKNLTTQNKELRASDKNESRLQTMTTLFYRKHKIVIQRNRRGSWKSGKPS